MTIWTWLYVVTFAGLVVWLFVRGATGRIRADAAELEIDARMKRAAELAAEAQNAERDQ